MKSIIGELEKAGVKDAAFYTKLRVTMNPFKYLGEDIDFGLFYEREQDELGKLRKAFPEL